MSIKTLLICMLACILLTAFGIKLAEPKLNAETAVTQNVPADSWNSTDAGQAEPASAGFAYLHDPNSKRLGSYAEYDWTDPALVAKAQEERRAYHESMDSMTDILYRMRDEGASIEEMARAVSMERNRIRLDSYRDNPEGLAAVKKSNLETYGHEDGPTPDELYEKYGSWTEVLQKAFSTNMGMDACCGLYDEYYQLYVELGYVD